MFTYATYEKRQRNRLSHNSALKQSTIEMLAKLTTLSHRSKMPESLFYGQRRALAEAIRRDRRQFGKTRANLIWLS
jgi:hypothetical protein